MNPRGRAVRKAVQFLLRTRLGVLKMHSFDQYWCVDDEILGHRISNARLRSCSHDTESHAQHQMPFNCSICFVPTALRRALAPSQELSTYHLPKAEVVVWFRCRCQTTWLPIRALL